MLQWQGDAAADPTAVWTCLRTEFLSCPALLVFGAVLPSKDTIDLIHSTGMARGGAMVGFLGNQQGIYRPSPVGLKPELSFRWVSLNNVLMEAWDLITTADARGAGDGLLAQAACTAGTKGTLVLPRLLLLDAPTVNFLLTRPQTPLELLRFLLEETASGRISAEAAHVPVAWAIAAAQATSSGESLVACATDPIYATKRASTRGAMSGCGTCWSCRRSSRRRSWSSSPSRIHRPWCRRLRRVHQRTARRQTQRRKSKQ